MSQSFKLRRKKIQWLVKESLPERNLNVKLLRLEEKKVKNLKSCLD